MPAATPVTTVGPRKLPRSNPATATPRPSRASTAPCAREASRMPSARCSACLLIMGPMSTPASAPQPTLRRRALSTREGIHSAVSPTKTATEIAMQRWPAAPNAAPTMPLRACSLLASGSTTAWFLAPTLHWHRLPREVAARYTCLPTAPLPTKETARTAGWEQRNSTTALPPCRRLKMPGGRPAWEARRAMIMAAVGTFSDGFRMNALPDPTAIGSIQSTIMAGKLNGAMPTTTPRGWRYDDVSMSLEICSTVSPIINVGMAIACSTTSIPRATSPSASTTVFPFSRTIACTISALFS
mmetsp:Transcript_69395/g.185185  ORF Transcript_69395/g.185185 Transcript_69395/m.185185 type:complete len:299 (-) Transcript_69395:230-1126(-)